MQNWHWIYLTSFSVALCKYSAVGESLASASASVHRSKTVDCKKRANFGGYFIHPAPFKVHIYLLCWLWGPKEDGDEGEPHNAGGVHGESDGLCLVERLGNPSGLDGINCAGDHQQHTVTQQTDEGQVGYVALEDATGHFRVGSTLVLIVNDGLWRVDTEPDAHSEELQRYQAERDDELGCRGDEARGADRHLALLKNPVDPICLGEQSRVAYAHAQAQENPSQRAYNHIRGGDHEEGCSVTQENTRQQHVAQLSTWRLNNGCVIVADEGGDHKQRGHDAQDGDEDRDDCPRGAPLQLDNGDGNAASVIVVRPQIKAAHLAGVRVCLVLVAITVLAVPTARDSLHCLLPLASPARLAANGGGDFLCPTRPLHLIGLEGKEMNLF